LENKASVKEAPPASELHPNIIYTQKQVFLQGIFVQYCPFLLILEPYGLAEPGEGAEAVQLSESLP
jgi:hypothetical protein